jgi:hypothetical protein
MFVADGDDVGIGGAQAARIRIATMNDKDICRGFIGSPSLNSS